MDIMLAFKQEQLGFDLKLDALGQDIDLQGDEGLLSAVIISLFTDARAQADDSLPETRPGNLADLRGWWGADIGSRLWLLSREKEMPVVVARAEQYAREALAWLEADGHVKRLRVRAVHVGKGHLGISVEFLLPQGAAPGRAWNFVYDYANATVNL